jgi:hypothetical protein
MTKFTRDQQKIQDRFENIAGYRSSELKLSITNKFQRNKTKEATVIWRMTLISIGRGRTSRIAWRKALSNLSKFNGI